MNCLKKFIHMNQISQCYKWQSRYWLCVQTMWLKKSSIQFKWVSPKKYNFTFEGDCSLWVCLGAVCSNTLFFCQCCSVFSLFQGYYRRTAEYFPTKQRQRLGCYPVPMVHSTILLDLRKQGTKKVSFHPPHKDYSWPFDDIIVFAFSCRISGMVPPSGWLRHISFILCNMMSSTFGFSLVGWKKFPLCPAGCNIL